MANGTGHYIGIEVTRGTATLELTYRAEPNPVDVFVVSAANLDAYKTDRAFIAKCADEVALSGSLSCRLETGEYFIVLDNTDYGHAKPVGDTKVTYAYRASAL